MPRKRKITRPVGRPKGAISNDTIDTYDQVLRLHNGGFNQYEIAEKVGTSQPRVNQMLKLLKEKIANGETLARFRVDKDDLYKTTELKMLLEMNDEKKIKEASLSQLASTLGTIHSINRLDNNLSTSNKSIQVLLNTSDDILEE